MSKLLLIFVAVVLVLFVWSRQQPRLNALRIQNDRLASIAGELQQRSSRADLACASAQQRLTDLRSQLTSRENQRSAHADTLASSVGAPLPDPLHQGGWPQGAPFLYLSKQFLTNADYRLLNGDHLTDEAAALFGMSPAERATADKLFGDLLGRFHQLELQTMQSVDPPAGWMSAPGPNRSPGLKFDSALTYRIPDLSQSIADARQSFAQQLLDQLGSSRAQLIASAADSYLRQDLEDLGSGDRVVGFVWQPESDGSHSLWYALADARHGEGSFQRVPDTVDPNSPVAYYARLFGVKLPGAQ